MALKVESNTRRCLVHVLFLRLAISELFWWNIVQLPKQKEAQH